MKKITILLFAISWLCACNNDIISDIPEAGGTEVNIPESGFPEEGVIEGRMRIKLKEEPTEQIAVRSVGGTVSTGIRALDSSATMLGVTRMERTFPSAGKYEERSRREGLHLWYDVWYSEEIATTRAVNNVSMLNGIEIACPIHKIKLNAAPMPSSFVESLLQTNTRGTELPWNDSGLSKQWNFSNSGTESWQIKGSDIRLVDVWKQYNGDPNIIIAVVDEGIDLDHPDLQANLWTNPNEIAGNGIDDDDNGFIDDIHGYNFTANSPNISPDTHGTHVAGILGATNQNGIGVCGVVGGDGTPNSGVKMMSCQILSNLSIDVNSPAAIKYAADNGAVICQNSWGYNYGQEIDPADKAAIDYFIKYAGCDNDGKQLSNSPMKGGIVLFATNNHNSSNPSDAAPADYEKVIGVAGLSPDYKKGSYSDYGSYIDISAPGGDKFYEGSKVYSTIPSSSYGYLYGASMACPHVSGVAALIIEKYGVGKKGFTTGQLTDILLNTAYNIDSYNPDYIGKLGSGCVNAAGALQTDLPKNQTFAMQSNSITNGILSFRVNTDLAGSAIITIRNSIGNKVFRKTMTIKQYNTTSLDISKLSAGYYTLQYECNGNDIKEKFIKY